MDNQIENQVEVQPKNQKSGKGKTAVIIILVILLLGAAGYIAYDKFLKEDKTKELQNEIKSLKTEINTLKQTQTTVDSKTIKVSDLYGTYTWTKKYKANVSGTQNQELAYNLKLVLNPDGTAIYTETNGIEGQQTKGTYKYEDGKIIYTRENYYSSDDFKYESNSEYVVDSEELKYETFNVLDKNTLQNTYYEQTTELKKQ